MIIYLSLLVALLGVLAFILSASSKLQELGRLAFACGLLAFLLCMCGGGHMVSIIPR